MDDELLAAVQRNDVDAVVACLAAGARLTAVTDFGESALHLAVHQGAVEMVSVLLRAGALVDARDLLDSTPLHWACKSRDAGCCCCRLLLSAGAPVNAADFRGFTPLAEAASHGSADCVAQLLSHGADVHAVDTQGYTPLHATAYCGSIPCAALLLEAGASLDAGDNDSGETPTEFAARFGHDDAAAFLAGAAAARLRWSGVRHLWLSTWCWFGQPRVAPTRRPRK